MKYKNFRTIGRTFGVLAWVIGIVTFIACLVSGVFAGAAGAVLGIVAGIILGFLSFAWLYAFSQFIYVIIDIEENTRRTRAAPKQEGE